MKHFNVPFAYYVLRVMVVKANISAIFCLTEQILDLLPRKVQT